MRRDLEGQCFGKLTAIRNIGSRKKRIWWLCFCSCGNEVEVASHRLIAGHTQSCGCLKRKRICRKGHSISGDNVYLSKNQPPRCKICKASLDKKQSDVVKENREPNRLACRRYRTRKPQQCLVWRYGITFEQKKKMENEQGGYCAICHRLMEKPCVDHDHETKQVRELLCRSCNLGIGHLQDDILIVESALDYLKKWKSNATSQSNVTPQPAGICTSTHA
jgi:hypothetical protein